MLFRHAPRTAGALLALTLPSALGHALQPGASRQAGPPSRVAARVDRARVGMGRSVTLTAEARDASGRPAAGCELYPFVDGRRWGHHERADENGRATFLLPLPTPGEAKIQVAAREAPSPAGEFWIWGPAPPPVGNLWLQRVFTLAAAPSADATLWVAVDDHATVYLNGEKVAEKGGWTEVTPLPIPATRLRAGENVLSVLGYNGAGPAGLLLRLQIGGETILSGPAWRVFEKQPPGWPGRADGGAAASAFGRSDSGAVLPQPWPTLPGALRRVGLPLPADLPLSPAVTVTVEGRTLQRPPADPGRLVAVQWEQWFTPRNNGWQTAEAIPLLGLYDSMDRAVARQHAIWLIESGADCLIADWSNNIWQQKRWEEVGQGTFELADASALMLDVLAGLRAEGHPVPKMTFLTGVSHVRPEGPDALNGQLAYIWNRFVANPKYRGLWQEFDGRPLILVLDTGASYVKEGLDKKIDPRWSVRWMGYLQETNKTHERGFWSWMDWQPQATRRGGTAEGLTASVGCFAPGGWLDPKSRGRRNGATLIEDFAVALKEKPRFLQLHQFNEFAGQLEGHPAAPPNIYVDCYSPELSDDFEPTSLTAPGYRGEGGWGFYALNLVRALVDLYRQPTPQTSVVAIARPLHRAVLTDPKLTVEWVALGKPARSYTLYANGRRVGKGLRGERATVDLAALPDGPVTLRLVAEGTQERYPLSWTMDELPRARPAPASMEVAFTLRRR